MNCLANELQTATGETANASVRILFVDDDSALLRMLKNCLSPYTIRWQIETTTDPQVAIARVSESIYDIVFVDVKMPAMDGFDLLDEIRHISPHTSVILMTGLPDIDAAIHAIRAGAVEYLRKPFGVHDVARLIEETLQDRRRRMGDTCRCITRHDRKIGEYTLVEKLDEGNMGTVYLARKTINGERREFATKVLKMSVLPPESRAMAIERFRVEAEIARGLNHPNVIRLFEYGFLTDKQTPYMVMEYFQGDTLDELIASGRTRLMSYRTRAEILRRIAAALSAVHRQIECHRDIKPANILINDELDVRLIDFGIAKVSQSDLTRSSCIMGTPSYIAPEAITTNGRIDRRADLFSLGVLAYELFLGTRPFLGANLVTLARQILNDDPAEPIERDPQIPRILNNLILGMLDKDPEQRFPTADRIVEVLDTYLATESGKVAIAC